MVDFTVLVEIREISKVIKNDKIEKERISLIAQKVMVKENYSSPIDVMRVVVFLNLMINPVIVSNVYLDF